MNLVHELFMNFHITLFCRVIKPSNLYIHIPMSIANQSVTNNKNGNSKISYTQSYRSIIYNKIIE